MSPRPPRRSPSASAPLRRGRAVSPRAVPAPARSSCSRSVQSRRQRPGAVRPARPARWSADARLICSMSSVLMPRYGSKRAIRAEPAVDHDAHAVDGQRGFGDVGGDDDLAPLVARHGGVLVGDGQFAVQRQDEELIRARVVADRLHRPVDLVRARHEDQHVAFRAPREPLELIRRRLPHRRIARAICRDTRSPPDTSARAR